MLHKYEKTRVAVDAVIFTIEYKALKVLLHTREKEPYIGRKELYGGLLLDEETAEDTLARKLHEVIGDQKVFFQQFYTFTAPDRDPRERAVSIGFIALVSREKLSNLVDWHPVSKLPGLAFDHEAIVLHARQYLKENSSSEIVRQFMPALFPLNRLQEVYETIEEKRYDNRNFRKKMITVGIVEETDDVEKNVSHRPARLYRFKR